MEKSIDNFPHKEYYYFHWWKKRELMMSKKYDLPRFKKALAPFSKALPVGTFWRYSNGILPPPFGLLLLEHPELARALAEDAAELAKERTAQPAEKGGDA